MKRSPKKEEEIMSRKREEKKERKINYELEKGGEKRKKKTL